MALTSDFWRSIANESYIGITCHAINSSWIPESFALAVFHTEDRHYSDNCANYLLEVIKEWGIFGKVSTITTDNARNIVKAINLLPFEHLSCAARSLQLCVNKGLSEDSIEKLSAKCRKIVAYFKQSPANYSELQQQQEILGSSPEALIQDVSTRWNSTLLMIERLLKHRNAVIAVLENAKTTVAVLTENEWEKLRCIAAILEPCKDATELLGGEKYVSCSIVLPTFRLLFRIMNTSDDDPAYIIRFKNAFMTELIKQQKKSNLNWLKVATALDPRFKGLKCIPKEERESVWVMLCDILQNEISVEHRETEVIREPPRKKIRLLEISSDSDEEEKIEPCELAFQILERYKSEPSINIDNCPLQWWMANENSHKLLSKIAKKYLASPATSVPCERLFSLSGYIANKQRSSLHPNNINKLVCLSNWLKKSEEDA